MSNLIASDHCSLIIGGGITGLSIARFLEKQGGRYMVFDTRSDSHVLSPFLDINPDVRCYSGEFDIALLAHVDEVLLSPGISRNEKVVQEAIARGISVRGDIALFLQHASAPVIGITGSNGKSTVTTLVGLSAKRAGIDVAVGGNLGTPALDLLEKNAELYVLEISSFQLESTDNASLHVAVNLNISADHLDRHGSMIEYFKAKQKIFFNAQNVVYNLNDKLTQPPVVAGVPRYGFGLICGQEKSETQLYFDTTSQSLLCDGKFLAKKADIKQPGLHNVENVLAVLAIALAANIHVDAVIDSAKEFTGLPHRCEWVATVNNVTFINDSKATNVGATLAALRGFKGEVESIILIAGGEGKGADFRPLGHEILASVSTLILIGKDASKIEAEVNGSVVVLHVDSMLQAVEHGLQCAQSGDLVLLSPACASFDMFESFEHRGDVFRQSVLELAA